MVFLTHCDGHLADKCLQQPELTVRGVRLYQIEYFLQNFLKKRPQTLTGWGLCGNE